MKSTIKLTLAISAAILIIAACKKEKDVFVIQGTLLEKATKAPMKNAQLEVRGWRYILASGNGVTLREVIETDENGVFTFSYDREINGDSVFDPLDDAPTFIEIELDSNRTKFQVELPWNVNINRTFETNY